MSLNSIKNSTIVVAGGSGFLGGFITRKLLDRGYNVAVVDREIGCIKTQDSSQSVRFFKADITDTEALVGAAEEIMRIYGSVAAVIQVASAPLIRQPILSSTAGDFIKQFSVNVFGAFNLYKNFCPIIKANGAIIGITSKAIEPGSIYSPTGSYLPAKLALRGLLRILAHELKERTIRVYGIAPAFMSGGLNNDIPATALDFIQRKSRPEDIARPEEVAETIIRLIEDASGEWNGKSIVVPKQIASDL